MLDLQMQIHGVNLDMLTNQPVVILKDLESKRYLPIWIGQFEATAILMELQGITASRPLTHDLMKSLLNQLNGKLEKVVIDDIEDGTFYAKLFVSREGTINQVDARPSDALALAVRMKVPIFAVNKVMEKAAIASELGEEEMVTKFREFLDNVNPEDFDKSSSS